jgi:hypothetical protein
MSPLEEFASRLRNELQAAERPIDPAPGDLMARLKGRVGLFQSGARHILDDLVEPRLTTLASFFPNA